MSEIIYTPFLWEITRSIPKGFLIESHIIKESATPVNLKIKSFMVSCEEGGMAFVALNVKRGGVVKKVISVYVSDIIRCHTDYPDIELDNITELGLNFKLLPLGHIINISVSGGVG